MTQVKKTSSKKTADSTFNFKLTIEKDKLNSEYQTYLNQINQQTETKGFRKGHSPKNIIEQKVSPSEILKEITSHLISHLYTDKVEQLGLKPIINPQIRVTNPPLELGKDVQIEVTGCEKPVIEIKKSYKKAISQINAKKDPKTDASKHLDQIITTLNQHSQAKIPQIILESDLNDHYRSLFAQLEKDKTTFSQFLKTKKQTQKDYEKSLETQIIKEWTFNLAIDKIALDEKISVDKQDIDPYTQHPQFKNNPNVIYFLILQRKVIKFLQDL